MSGDLVNISWVPFESFNADSTLNLPFHIITTYQKGVQIGFLLTNMFFLSPTSPNSKHEHGDKRRERMTSVVIISFVLSEKLIIPSLIWQHDPDPYKQGQLYLWGPPKGTYVLNLLVITEAHLKTMWLNISMCGSHYDSKSNISCFGLKFTFQTDFWKCNNFKDLFTICGDLNDFMIKMKTYHNYYFFTIKLIFIH